MDRHRCRLPHHGACLRGFFIICFSVGAVAAAVTTLVGGLGWQVFAFVVFAALSIFLVRPFALKYLHDDKPKHP